MFTPFTADTLPANYANEYEDELDQGRKAAMLRMYRNIHSLSRAQLATYNGMEDSEDKAVFLEIQQGRYNTNKLALEHALRRGRNVNQELINMGLGPAAGGGLPADGGHVLNVSNQLNQTVADGVDWSDETVHLTLDCIPEATKALLPPDLLEELLHFRRKERGNYPEVCAHYNPETHK